MKKLLIVLGMILLFVLSSFSVSAYPWYRPVYSYSYYAPHTYGYYGHHYRPTYHYTSYSYRPYYAYGWSYPYYSYYGWSYTNTRNYYGTGYWW